MSDDDPYTRDEATGATMRRSAAEATEAFESIMAGLEAAVAYAGGDVSKGKASHYGTADPATEDATLVIEPRPPGNAEEIYAALRAGESLAAVLARRPDWPFEWWPDQPLPKEVRAILTRCIG